MTAGEIQKAVGGRLLGSRNVQSHGVCIDSRQISEKNLFIAVHGKNFDGNDFVAEAFSKGAAVALAERDMPVPEGRAVIVVENTSRALLELSGFWRRKFDIHLVGVTGSAGKTTTKEMIFHALSSKYKTHKNVKNLNNEVGVPLTLFNLGEEHEAAVVEMGMSARGEISRLTRAARPTVAVITNIGMSHIEHLKSRENILLAKLEILEGLQKDKTVVLNADDPYLGPLRDLGCKTVFYGINSDCDFKAENIGKTDFEVQGVTVRLPVLGRHNVYNALAAITAANVCGVPVHMAARGIENYKTDNLRQSFSMTEGGATIICDCYNANPQSMAAALELLCDGEGRKIAVLGDMLELGDYARESHEKIGRMAADLGVSCLIAVGGLSAYTARAARENGVKEVQTFDNNMDAAKYIKELLKSGDRVLIKGSRGMKMEEIYQEIMG